MAIPINTKLVKAGTTTALLSFLLVVSPVLSKAQNVKKVTINPEIDNVSFSAVPAKSLRVLFDYYHHTRPNTKVGNHLITGSWLGGTGRYGWDDFVHSNTFDPVFASLEKEYFITIGGQSFKNSTLANQDAVLIINPDNPKVVPEVPVITDAEIATLQQYVKNGGSLMVMINGGGPERTAEDFESVQLRKLVKSFGLDWFEDDTHYSDVMVEKHHPYFYDVPLFHYGAGCTIKILPAAQNPEILMQVASDAGYPEKHVKGPGMVQVRYGKGKFILVGDAGSWTANMSRPWAENELILKQLFRYLKPNQKVVMPTYPIGKTLNYEFTVGGLQAIPTGNTVSTFPKETYKMFYPRPITGMPYLEGTANLALTAISKTDNQASNIEVKVNNFMWFDSLATKEAQQLNFVASRQGKVSEIIAKGKMANWLTPDVSSLVALLPVEGIRPGDRWESKESLRIPILQGTDLAPVKPIVMEISYVKDTVMNGKRCRFLRSSAEIWASDLDIQLSDIFPKEEINKVGGSNFQFFHPKRGKVLYKREQWVDMATGIVEKAKTQIRLICWVRDLRKPIQASNADKDFNMFLSLAQATTFTLK
jgi:glutamine amidotransferase-like uncharacterized protein